MNTLKERALTGSSKKITISIQIRMNGKTSKKMERSYFVIPVFNQLYVMLRKIMAMIR
jgi:hypothetical protein